jgi:predicted secreted protein
MSLFRKCLAFLATCPLLFLPLTARADEGETLFNRVFLEAQAEREVQNDEIVTLLVSRQQGNSPQEIANRVNADMEWALKEAKRFPEVQVATQGYATSPRYEKGIIQGWEAQQELRLRSTAVARATELVGVLQSRLQVASMQFQPTDTLRDRVADELVEEALMAFRHRAELVGKHMDGKNYRIVELHVSTQGSGGPVRYAERAVMMAKDAGPAVEAGASKVQVTVSGSVQYY